MLVQIEAIFCIVYFFGTSSSDVCIKLNKSTHNSTKAMIVATGNDKTGLNKVRADNFNGYIFADVFFFVR